MRNPPPSDTPPRVERLGTVDNGDTTLSAVLRFGLEVAAWIGIQRVWGWGVMIAAILVLAVFNARGDKRVRGIEVPGVVRLGLETGLIVAGIMAVTTGFGAWPGIAMTIAFILQIISGRRRYLRLLRQ